MPVSNVTSPFVKKSVEQLLLKQVDLLCLRSETGPYAESVRQMVTRLQQAGQVTPRSLDGMLCHTPIRKKRPVGIFDKEQPRRVSRRTLRSLQSNLLSD